MKFNIIPEPSSFTCTNDKTVFTLTHLVNIEHCEKSTKAYNALINHMRRTFEIEPLGTGKEHIFLKVDPSVGKSEAYVLTVTENRIDIIGSDGAGVFYAVQTLFQLLLQDQLELPELTITDEPEFSYRGFMLDVARYYHSPDAVKLFLDVMAIHKLNTFHWHLTDDQGWRIELENNLLLSQIGSYRPYTNFGRTPHSGYYTKSEIEDIINYAHERYIKVIPEIESPGHIVSAIAAYPHLSCFDRNITIATHSGVKNDVLCVGKGSSFEFMFSVFDEICEMFPDKIIHIGGDEVPVVRWEICPHCQKRIKELGLKDESELYAYYINRIAAYLESKGFTVIMWNNKETENKISPDLIKQYWDSTPGENADASKIIDSDSTAYYLDLPYGHISLKSAYEHKPNFNGNKPFGVEACLWSEYVPNVKKAGYCTFPRLGAFCETAWSKEENKSYSRFIEKLPDYYALLDTVPIDYAKKKQAIPNIIRKLGYNLYFERRKLHWQGLHNIIDNKKVEKLRKDL